MNPVMTWGVEYLFDPARQLPNQRGVNKKLVDQRQCVGDAYPYRIKAQQSQRQIKGPAAIENVGGVLAHGRGKVHSLRGMMNNVGGPEPSHAVAGAMHPVEAKIHA